MVGFVIFTWHYVIPVMYDLYHTSDVQIWCQLYLRAEVLTASYRLCSLFSLSVVTALLCRKYFSMH